VPYFLDGSNLLGGRRGGEERRDALIREICERLRKTRAKVALFFDGPEAGGAAALGNLTLRFSGRRSADDEILAEIARSRAPSEVVVVTADRELGRRARDAGARSLAPSAFWERFGSKGRESSEDVVPSDVEEWARYFEDEKNRQT
jgi:YacP-like NYN domain-containing protein